MRSRFSAYALGEVEYILQTTHPSGEHFREDTAAWFGDVERFCRSTEFVGLDLLETRDDEVTFRARLRQGGEDASFVERSSFAKHEGRWAYLSGEPGSR